MIYQRLRNFPVIKYAHLYLNIIAATIQVISTFFLYPCVYPIFDGMSTFTYFFIASSILMVMAYIIENVAGCFCGQEKSFLSIITVVISFVSSVLLLVGGIIYSPLIGHQQDREKVFIVGESGFLAFQLIKFLRAYKENNCQLNLFDKNGNIELEMSVFAGLSWFSQLIGTYFFVYSVYNQELFILGAFFYGLCSLLWGIRTWILAENAFKSDYSPANDKMQAQWKRLNQGTTPIQ